MDITSLENIKYKLENYKSTHPNLYKIYKIYIEKHELQILKNNNNLLIYINNLENVKDLSNKEIYALYNLMNLNIT